VDAGSEAVGAVAAPEAGVRVEPQAGEVVVVKGTAADEGVGTGRVEWDTGVEYLVEGGMSSLDAGDDADAKRRRRERRSQRIAGTEKREKAARLGSGKAQDRRRARDPIDSAGRMNGRGNGTGARGLELAAGLSSRGQQFVGEEKGVKTARSLLDESLDRHAKGGAPGLVGRGVVPIGDEEAGGAADEASKEEASKEDAEVSVGIEEPLAGEGSVGDVGLARAKAGLKMLGARFERQEMDALLKPPASAGETGQARGAGMGSHSCSRSAMALRTEVSSMTDFWSIMPAIRAVVQTWLMRRGRPLVYSKTRVMASSVKRVSPVKPATWTWCLT
jgi:hypothetical protein